MHDRRARTAASGGESSPPPGDAARAEPAGRPALLIVDDDPQVRDVLQRAMARRGFEVVAVGSAEAALELEPATAFDVVVADLLMPGMSGLELIGALRARPRTALIPIIVMTGSASQEALVPALEGGADDFVTKPVQVDELVARIRSRLRTAGVWSDVVRSAIRERVGLVEALAALTAPTPSASTLTDIVRTIGLDLRASFVGLYEVRPDLGLRPLACFATDGASRRGGPAIVPSRAAYLLDRAAHGAWAEPAPPRLPNEPEQGLWRAAPDLLAGAPIHVGERLVALLAITTSVDPAGGGSPLQRARLQAAASDVASLLSATIGGSIEASGQSTEERRRLQRILDRRAFDMAFQPIVDLDLGVILGYEALTRFSDGARPDVQFAEATAVGLGPAFEMAAVRAAVERFGDRRDGFLTVNLSPSVIVECRAELEAVVRGAGAPLVIEVTEHVPILDYAELRAAVRSLGETRLAIDDAGAGYASLRHIVQLSPSFAKLDMSLVRDIQDDPVRRALITGLAHSALLSGIDLIAEGIETEAEAATLRDLGVELGQGYLFGKPGPLPPE